MVLLILFPFSQEFFVQEKPIRGKTAKSQMCHGQKSLYWGWSSTLNRNPYNGYINPYYWVDDHPLLYGNHGSLDPSTNEFTLLTRETLRNLFLLSQLIHHRLSGQFRSQIRHVLGTGTNGMFLTSSTPMRYGT